MRGVFETEVQTRGEYVGKDKVGDYTIDTCTTGSLDLETAILKEGGDWLVVEYYDTFEEAEEGHKKWCDFCRDEPKEAYSVKTEKIETF